jgi:hypothetical protein
LASLVGVPTLPRAAIAAGCLSGHWWLMRRRL